MSELREIEKVCGKNCLRKYDKVYKLYEATEGEILTSYMDDNNFDPADFMKQAQEEIEMSMQNDSSSGLDLIKQNKL